MSKDDWFDRFIAQFHTVGPTIIQSMVTMIEQFVAENPDATVDDLLEHFRAEAAKAAEAAAAWKKDR